MRRQKLEHVMSLSAKQDKEALMSAEKLECVESGIAGTCEVVANARWRRGRCSSVAKPMSSASDARQ